MEVCVDSLQSVVAAYEGGANRIELCSSLNEGGLTPSYGLLKSIRNYFNKSQENHRYMPINCMIRCRSGDFLYSDQEIETMLEDLKKFIELEVDGLVFGMLTPDGQIDSSLAKEFLSLIPNHIKKTFHRAFDVCCDWRQGFEELTSLGFDSLLTSGQQQTALDGLTTIKSIVELRNSLILNNTNNKRVNIIAGAGVNSKNLSKILIESKCDEFHASCRRIFISKMNFKNNQISMGSPLINEFETKHTDKNLVQELVDIYNKTKIDYYYD
jgi:copper homeostasis protein